MGEKGSRRSASTGVLTDYRFGPARRRRLTGQRAPGLRRIRCHRVRRPSRSDAATTATPTRRSRVAAPAQRGPRKGACAYPREPECRGSSHRSVATRISPTQDAGSLHGTSSRTLPRSRKLRSIGTSQTGCQHFPFQTKPAVPGLARWAAGRDRTAASCWLPDHQSHVPESQTACFDRLSEWKGVTKNRACSGSVSSAGVCAPVESRWSGLPPAWSTPILDRVGYAAGCRSLLSRVDCAWSERRQRF